MYIINKELTYMGRWLRNLLFYCLPADWFCDKCLRPFLLRLFGAKCGHAVVLKKGFFHGSLRNIKIGNRTWVNSLVFFDATGKIVIGDKVSIGFQASLITSTHEIGPPDCRCGDVCSEDIVIENGVWIGSCATIGPGVTIGAGSIVSAGAVVMRSMPPNRLIAGSPARVIRKLEE
ncbi:MAG: acyltransferase [Planctomycetota bacterium]|nr:MAG: acyltransferase [Planctomycetota bacterium]